MGNGAEHRGFTGGLGQLPFVYPIFPSFHTGRAEHFAHPDCQFSREKEGLYAPHSSLSLYYSPS